MVANKAIQFNKDMFYKDIDLQKRKEFIDAINKYHYNPFDMIRFYANSDERGNGDRWNIYKILTPTPTELCIRLANEYCVDSVDMVNGGTEEYYIDIFVWYWIMEVYNEFLWTYDISMSHAIDIISVENLYDMYYPAHERSVSSFVNNLCNGI